MDSSSTLPNIQTNFADWYNNVVFAAELADHAPVRGCIIIRPYGYALWEQITAVLDKKIKDTGHHNAAFPLLIPQSFIAREKEHVAGFAPELAVVTHAGGKELEEPLIVRPTSETIIHYMFAQWLKSWRDLPIKINQWASVVRWEMRARPFLRTTEFWWQEGHTAHETEAEARAEAELMLKEYVDLVENYLAIPVITGKKSVTERFAGATETYTLEGIMPDGRALQMGTSHMISQTFAHAFDMKYQNREGREAYPYLTSWGVTTRLIGALIMTHGDQKGLIMPPKVAPIQLVIVPIIKDDSRSLVMDAVNTLMIELKMAGMRVHLDDRSELTPGAKYYHWELRGVPLRIEVGPRDIGQGVITIVDRLTGKKQTIQRDVAVKVLNELLRTFQADLFARAGEQRNRLRYYSSLLSEFGPRMEAEGGVYQTGWCQEIACEQAFKSYKGTTRCLVPERTQERCAVCGKSSLGDVLVAKAY